MNLPIKQHRSHDETREMILPGLKVRQLKADFDRNMLLILVQADPKYLQDHGLKVNHHQQRFLHSHQLSQCGICLQVKGRDGFSTSGKWEWQTRCKCCNATSVDPVAMAERNAEYRQQNKEYFAKYLAKYQAEYRQTPHGKAMLKRKNHKRRAIKKQNVTIPYSLKELEYRFSFFEGECAYCRVALLKKDVTIDHFVPVAKGGHEAVYNLFPVCKPCNSSKSASDFQQWYMRQRFFNEGRLNLLQTLAKSELYCKPKGID